MGPRLLQPDNMVIPTASPRVGVQDVGSETRGDRGFGAAGVRHMPGPSSGTDRGPSNLRGTRTISLSSVAREDIPWSRVVGRRERKKSAAVGSDLQRGILQRGTDRTVNKRSGEILTPREHRAPIVRPLDSRREGVSVTPRGSGANVNKDGNKPRTRRLPSAAAVSIKCPSDRPYAE